MEEQQEERGYITAVFELNQLSGLNDIVISLDALTRIRCCGCDFHYNYRTQAISVYFTVMYIHLQ